jgi:hypothetical protein
MPTLALALPPREERWNASPTTSGEESMTVSVQSVVAHSFAPMLRSLDAILDKATAFAEEKGIDLVNARLAPDMFTLAQQVQIATYFARETPSRLKGASPAGDMGEAATSIAGMREQIAAALEVLRAAGDDPYDGADERDCSIDIPNADMTFAMNGTQYLLRWSLPNFYFHLVTAYDILRSEGLEIGKREYLAGAGEFMRPKG